MDNCATGSCKFYSNILRHHLSQARLTERCNHLPLDVKFCCRSVTDFFSPFQSGWLLRSYNILHETQLLTYAGLPEYYSHVYIQAAEFWFRASMSMDPRLQAEYEPTGVPLPMSLVCFHKFKR